MTSDRKDERVRQEFRRASEYSEEYSKELPISHLFKTRLHRVAEMLESNAGRAVLDVGCGPAKIAATFRDTAFRYHGIDISEDMIRECHRQYPDSPNLRFSVGRIEDLPISDGEKEIVLCLGAFEYLTDERAALKQIARTMTNEGTLIISMQNSRSPQRLWSRFILEKAINAWGRIGRIWKRPEKTTSSEVEERLVFRTYTERKFRDLLESEHFIVEDVVYYNFNLFLGPLDRMFSGASNWLSARLEALGRTRVKWLGTDYIIKARKLPRGPDLMSDAHGSK